MKVHELCFSPTGGTQKVAEILTNALADEVVRVDLTDSKADFGAIALGQEDIAVIAVPSYAGRVPAPAVQRLSAVHGNGARAVLVCVYGNRAYEDTLVELQDTAKQAGFRVIGAVAAVAEHSIARQFAGRQAGRAGYPAPARVCRANPCKALRRRCCRADNSRQSPLQKSGRGQHGTQSHQGVY